MNLDELTEGLNPAKDAEMLALLESRVSELLQTQPEYLMSYLYRLDVPEADVQAALNDAVPGLAIAKALWVRQKKRIKTKLEVKSAPLGADEADWKW